ncbi:growth hormone receptor a [Esox lucius]|uniref:Fibronectin type-III domain-containing protein n=1 Tax=Esox lucius TaxID=8010 RepID=A0A3P8X9A9_ESOLU|nr:growth hormone receptor a [Esox lucius]XP_010890757.3 growth hormone receptor a [Esox lucius]XP_010890758.3 growth hormone receptor a [Esox lucius]XP_034152446.1 growth hormone receptor a [Esox lucius]XP_034152447.1 growth hormone receptor a [Esox lucius]
MACSSFLLLLFPSLGWLSAVRSASLMDPGFMMSSDPPLQGPRFTGCKSREQVTFSCWWSAGSFRNLTELGGLQMFYWKKNDSPNEWRECPDYPSSVKNECFFDKNHTVIWTTYCVRLTSVRQNITYDELCFELQDIVHPDPPVGVNWTLLNVSQSGLRFDIMVSWERPPTADIPNGWLNLAYEVQYRMRNSSHWKVFELEFGTQKSIYGLRTGEEYEVRVHCAMRAFNNFGDFSDPIVVHVPLIPSKDSTFPLTLVLIFGAVGLAIVLMLIVFSQQQRLMMILLPPVPAPKIKGIDPELLKKGKLDELNFILRGGGMGRLHSYPLDLYQDEPWVEFIELDADKPEPGEKEDNLNSDTRRLLGLGHNNHHTNRGCSHALSIPDDDSGRASCYDPELPDQETLMFMAALLSNQPDKVEPCLGNLSHSSIPALEVLEVTSSGHQVSERGERPRVHAQPGGTQSWVNMDFYAQVSDVTPTGGVVLSPGQQVRAPENTSTKEEARKKNHGRREGGQEEREVAEGEEEESRRNKPPFQLSVVGPEAGGYTTESSTPNPFSLGEIYHTFPPPPVETKPYQEACPPPSYPLGGFQSPYVPPNSPPVPSLAPVSDYTVVQDVDSQHSLLLNPPSPRLSPPGPPQPLSKPLPAMPMGYLTPDLLGNLLP